MVVAVQTGCMPDFNAITSKWQSGSGAGGKGGHAGASNGSGGHPAQGGATNGGTSTAGEANGGRASGGKPNGNAGRVGAGGTGVSGTGPGGEAGIENGGNGGAEGGAPGTGGTGVGGSTPGTGGTSPNGGEAGAVCDPGFVTCPGGAECGTNLSHGNPTSSTFANCGACGVTCATTNTTSIACTAGQCAPSCAANFQDCNGPTANDGCEADLTSATTCGACGHLCSNFGAMTRACTSGHCAPACRTGYLDCTADSGSSADDGCETFVDSLTACGAACGTAGIACDPTQVCNTGVCGAAAGLVAMSIPFTASGQGQRFADLFAAGPDLTYATVTARFYAPGATNGTLSTYLVDTKTPNPGFSPLVVTDFATLSAGWIDITVPVPAPGGTFDTTHLHQITFDFDCTGAPSVNPTVIYLDRVWSSDGVINDTFDSAVPTIISSSFKKLDGSTFAWASAVP